MIIQLSKNEELRGLCSHDHPVTDNLFGDDLEKTVEGIVKRNKVDYRISGGYRGKGKRISGRCVAKSSNFKKEMIMRAESPKLLILTQLDDHLPPSIRDVTINKCNHFQGVHCQFYDLNGGKIKEVAEKYLRPKNVATY
jgi:hypothetical protein